jgi:O-antigen ligase
MKKLLFINDTVVNKISYYHLAAFVAALPFDLFYSEIILVSFGLHTLIHAPVVKFKNIFTKAFLILVAFYLLGLIAVLYSTDKKAALSEAGKQSALLIFPVLCSLTALNLEKYRLHLFQIFGLACVLAISYLYVNAFTTLGSLHLPFSGLLSLPFMNHNFALPLAIHATYLAAYCAFAAAIFLFLLFTANSNTAKCLYTIAILILLAGIIQLSSRAVFVAFLIVLNIGFPFLLFKKRKRLLFLITASVISIVSLTFIYSIDAFKERYISNLKTDLSNEVKIIENTEPRASRWAAIMELVKESPVIGYGNGSETTLLKEKYYEKGLYISFLNELNSHNEYLSILIKMGVIGLVFFGYALYFGFARAIVHKDVLLLSFMVIITVVCCSENLLDLNKGIFFYSFFMSFFLLPAAAESFAAMPLLSKQATVPE